jgi:tyrosyl-tRNA synthetase
LETGMSFTEFSYQLVQGYDFYWLWKNKNCKVQLGGSDQWGNIVTGTELVRRKGGGKAFAVTTPLIKKADGGKFGKTESGNVWLDKTKTSPYKFYQFWLNSTDDDAKNYIKMFTLLSQEEIAKLTTEHEEAPHLRVLQKVIAEEVTTRVHCKEDLEMAIKASNILFGKSTAEDLKSLYEETFLSVFEGVPQFEMSKADLALGILDIVAEKTQIFASKGEARRMIKSNAVSINKIKITEDIQLSENDLLNGKYILAQKGKKNYFLIILC